MSHLRRFARGLASLVEFAKVHLAGVRMQFLAVLLLEAGLTAITGIGLLLVLPLLGLLGVAGGGADSPLWSQISGAINHLGITLTLETGLVLFVIVIVLRAVLVWRRQTWQVEVEQRFQTSLRTHLYEALSRAELYSLQRLRTSEFIQSTQGEIRRVQQATNTLFQLFFRVLQLGAYFAVAVILSREMTIFAFVCGAAAALIMLPLVKRTHALSRQEIRVRSSMINNLVEHVQGLRTARSLGLTRRFVADYQQRSRQAAAVAVRLVRLSAVSTLAFEIVAVVLLATLVYVGLTRFEVAPARFIVLLLVFIRVFPAIGQFQNELQRFVSLLPSFTHYRDLVAELEKHREAAPSEEGRARLRLDRVLELRNVLFRYHEDSDPALRDLSLQVEKGSLTAIAGHSGAGKSTLVDIATGLLPPSEGGLYLDGQLLDEHGRIGWRRETALVPQDSFLFNESVRANLTGVRHDVTDQQLWEALDAANCRSFVESRPGGLDSQVGERGVMLSGGERQRLSIARALLREPQLLVLDEPTNNLDAASVAALIEILGSLKRRATLLVVSHDHRILECADRVCWLEDGVQVEKVGTSRHPLHATE